LKKEHAEQQGPKDEETGGEKILKTPRVS